MGLRARKQDALAAFLLLLLLESLFTVGSQPTEAASASLISPSSGWGIFAGTVGDIEVVIDCPGIAVRIEIPREFLKGRKENDTSFLSSDISNDYYYYSVIDQSLHYSHHPEAPGYKPDFPPYDPNAPYAAEIWGHDGTHFMEFTPPKHVWMRSLTAPPVAGKYDFLVYVAEKTYETSRVPLFPTTPTRTLPVVVNMGPFPGSINGYIVDSSTNPILAIRAKGAVYAFDTAGKLAGRSFVDNSTGFYNLIGLSEGEYTLEASAGYWSQTGYAYIPTRYTETVRIFRDGNLTVNIPLNRGCIIKGNIKYTDYKGSPVPSLSHPAFTGLAHPWTDSIDSVTSLNYTVDAINERGEVVASFSAKSTGSTSDPFVLVDRGEARYLGHPSVGTAFSGIPPGRYTIRAWVFGYVQRRTLDLVVTTSATEKAEIALVTGGIIAGNISFRDPRAFKPETPRTAEKTNFEISTGSLYGGNILISAYDSTGQLAATTVIRGTMPNGTTTYADCSNVRFHLIGFSESLDQTYSGVWRKRDYGIPYGTYNISVQVRGYRQSEAVKILVNEGLMNTANVRLLRQGAISTVVASRATVAGSSQEVPWAFGGLTPQPYLRVYMYTTDGSEIGFVESRIDPSTLVTRTLPLNFTGRSCTIQEITYQGYVPNFLAEGTYSLKAFTFGHVQLSDMKVMVPKGFSVQNRILVDRGFNINGTVLLKADGYRSSLTEKTQVRIEAHGSLGLVAALDSVSSNPGASNFDFTLIGLRGIGHFFYVAPNGHRMKDYGILAGKYTVKVHDFGVEWRYRATYQPTILVNRQTSGSTILIIANRMSKVYGKVWGMATDTAPIPLSWVAITAGLESCFSLDGMYTLHLEQGTSQLVFSLPGYLDRLVIVTVAESRVVELDVTLTPI